MPDYTPDNSGITSLNGFSYQIRVFVNYMLQMNENESIGFETWDDVAIKQATPSTLDSYSDSFRSMLHKDSEITAIQVKHTSLDTSTSKQILFNWMLLESSTASIKQYVLYTDKSYGNTNSLFDLSPDSLYEEVRQTEKNRKSAIRKVKECINSCEEFKRIFLSIKSKYHFVDEDIDNEIEKNCRVLFRKEGVNPYVFSERISELLNAISAEILDSVNKNKPFEITYGEMMRIIEDISERISNQFILPAYSDYKKNNPIDFSSLAVANSREYAQLLACKLPKSIIKTHLIEEGYYQHVRYGYMEMNRKSKIECIEETTFDNFERAKYYLQEEGRDIPSLRLKNTIDASNSYASDDQIRHGAGIYLTRQDELEHQISWKDSDNEEN